MTSEEAITFERYSPANAIILSAMASSRGCQCQPYEDWYTYKRWLAQKMQVQRGEKATQLMTFIPVYKIENGERIETGKRPWTSSVFCRCQVRPKDGE